MNAIAIPVQDLACPLLDAAGGIPAGTGISTGQPLAVISWYDALHTLEDGLLPCASSGQAILRIAASLGDPRHPRSPARRPRQPRPAQHHPGHRRQHSRQRLTPPVSHLTG